MSRLLLLTTLLLLVAGAALAQGSARLWYSGPFDGWVEAKAKPAYGFYYQPASGSLYPLNEASYGQPVPCAKCGHSHWPGETTCPYCGCQCSAGGNGLDPKTVYSTRPLPGMYLYEKPSTLHFAAPLHAGPPFLKYPNR